MYSFIFTVSFSHLYMVILISEHFHYHFLKDHWTVFSSINLIGMRYVSVTFFFTLLYIWCPVFSELPIATTITLLTPVSCCYMTSFKYGGKKARDVGLTCRWHLSNIMPGSIFCDSMGWGDDSVFFTFFS